MGGRLLIEAPGAAVCARGTALASLRSMSHRLLAPLLAALAAFAAGCDGEPSTDAGPTPPPDAGPAPEDAEALDAGDPPDGGDPPGAFPHVATLQLPESFARNPDGTYGLTDGTELFDVGRSFYEEHDDLYDMLIVWTDAPIDGIFAFSVPVDQTIDGIGQQEVMARYGWDDYTPAIAGSAGRLEHLCLMNDPSTYRGAAYSAQEIVTHEVGHRWSANVSLASATDPDILVDEFWSHWTILANVGGPSAVGYGETIDNGDGTFTYEIVRPLRYSRLELYQQGLLDASEVGEMFYVEGATDFDAPLPAGLDSIATQTTFRGTRTDFTIDDVIATYGPRVPAHPNAQTEFRMAFVLLCDGACEASTLEWVDAQRGQWEETFAMATGGRASVDTTLAR